MAAQRWLPGAIARCDAHTGCGPSAGGPCASGATNDAIGIGEAGFLATAIDASSKPGTICAPPARAAVGRAAAMEEIGVAGPIPTRFSRHTGGGAV